MVYNVIIKNAIFLNIMHNTFNIGDTEIVICIILVLINRAPVARDIDPVLVKKSRYLI
jgi:hypothetical protein